MYLISALDMSIGHTWFILETQLVTSSKGSFIEGYDKSDKIHGTPRSTDQHSFPRTFPSHVRQYFLFNMTVNMQTNPSADFASLMHELGQAISSFGTQIAAIGAKYTNSSPVSSPPITIVTVPKPLTRKSLKRVKDENAPKQPLGPFLVFCQEVQSRVQAEFPNLSQREVAKKLGERWEALGNKQDYLERAKEKRKVYTQALAEYEAKKEGVASVEEESAKKKAKKSTLSSDVISSDKKESINKLSPIKENVKENIKPVNMAPIVVSEPASQSTIGAFSQERTKSKEERRKERRERKKHRHDDADATTTTDTDKHK